MAIWTQTVVPAVPVLSLAQALAHLRQDAGLEDDLINDQVAAATDELDGPHGLLSRCLISQQWRREQTGWPVGRLLCLGLAPLISVDAVQYRDAAGVTQTLSASNYRVFPGDAAAIELIDGYFWPEVEPGSLSVSVLATYGYGTAASDVPAGLVSAVRVRLGQLYEHRESVVVGTIASAVPLGYRDMIERFKFSHIA